MSVHFYHCKICGNVIDYIKNAGVPVTCCGATMEELIPGAIDAAQEKHVPVVSVEGQLVTVKVGSVEHPSTEAHFIEWITLETKQGRQHYPLKAGQPPEAVFALTADDAVIAAYAHCNLHGLWIS